MGKSLQVIIFQCQLLQTGLNFHRAIDAANFIPSSSMKWTFLIVCFSCSTFLCPRYQQKSYLAFVLADKSISMKLGKVFVLVLLFVPFIEIICFPVEQVSAQAKLLPKWEEAWVAAKLQNFSYKQLKLFITLQKSKARLQSLLYVLHNSKFCRKVSQVRHFLYLSYFMGDGDTLVLKVCETFVVKQLSWSEERK